VNKFESKIESLRKMNNDELKEAPFFLDPSSPVVSGTSLLHCLPHAHTTYFGNSQVLLNFSKQSHHLFEIKKNHTCVGEENT